MPPRAGQLDEISEAIGGLRASFEGIERYMHEREHGINNLSQKIDGLAVKLAADIAAVEARMDSRLKALELGQNSMSTAKQIAIWIVQTLITVVAAVATVLSMGRVR